MTRSLARVPCTITSRAFSAPEKTTLIRHVLAHAQGRRLAVIVNEFGDVGIDGEILKGCGDAACRKRQSSPTAACVARSPTSSCTTLDAVISPASLPVEHIVIDLAGLALPKPFVHLPLARDQEPRDRGRCGGGGRRCARERAGGRRSRSARESARR